MLLSRSTRLLLKSRVADRCLFSTQIKKVGMVGMGLMGHGIAQTAATAGYEVVAYDMKQEFLNNGMDRIKNSLAKLESRAVKKNGQTPEAAHAVTQQIWDRLQPTTELRQLAECDLVIEAIVEDVDVKKPFYQQLQQLFVDRPDTIFASNTSSLQIADFANDSGRPQNMVGLHFFNPVQMMKLVEVVKTDQTDPAVFEACQNFIKSIGKTPVSCKDTPGFIVNRLLVPNISQALLLLERNDATKEDIDVSMQFGAGHPMGPITLADYVGLDIILFILEGWVKKYPNDPSFVIPKILQEKVKAGKLGRKTGEGFYKWDGDKRV